MPTPSISESNSVSQNLLRSRMPELDTLRGIAVLSVVLFHGFGLEYGLKGLTGLPKLLVAATLPGWAGVNLFFVLSGFLITGILLDTRECRDYYRRFYLRRALRILPLYYAVLILLAVLSRTGLIARPASWSFLGLSFIYLANVTQLFGVPMQYGVLWSLAVEEHFYLLWPTAVRLLSRRGLVCMAAAICFACPLLRALFYWRHYAGVGYGWLSADGLALGVLLAILSRSSWVKRPRFKQVAIGSLTASLLIFSLGAPFGILLTSRLVGFIFRETTLDLFCFGLVSSTLLVGTSRWKAIVNRPVLQFLGEVSYGVYLIHMLVFDVVDHAVSRVAPTLVATQGDFGRILLRFCLGASCTFAVAYLSRWYFEEPFLRLKGRLAGQTVATATKSRLGGSLLVPVIEPEPTES
ncbi:MAG: acyltransferase [Acidobacteriia bacterium]|nr:acyltransferase [Terriglobia bacterium]